MKKYIGITLQVEGIHQWSDVASTDYCEEVGYLQYPHRHTFVIECTLEVHHDNREVEFIVFKHQVNDWIHKEFWSTNDQLCVFGEMSCEMIAELLMGRFDLYSCKVSEDGENFAYLVNENQ